MRILICEDDPIQSMALEMALEEAGHEVVGVHSRADKAILHCWREAPELVLVDLNLADGDTGESLIRALDALGIPSIVVSAQLHRLTKIPPTRAVVAKPYFDRVLLDAVAIASKAA